MQHARVAAVARRVARPDDLEQLPERALLAHNARRQIHAVALVALFGVGDEPLGVRPQRLRLGRGGADALVFDQRRDHVPEHRDAVRGGPIELLSPMTL